MAIVNTKNWTFNVNQPCADSTTILQQCRSYIKFLFEQMLATGWTILYTSNGTTFSSANNLTTLANFNWGTTNFTQFTLLSPEGFIKGPSGTGTGTQSKVYMTIACNTAVTTNFTILQYLTLPTAGGVSTLSTSSDQIIKSTQYMRTAITTTPIFHFSSPTEGQFWSAISYTASGNVPFFFHVLAFETTRLAVLGNGKPYPYAYFVATTYNDAASNPAENSLTGAGKYTGYDYDGLPTSSNAYMRTLGLGTSQTNGDQFGVMRYSKAEIEVTTTNKQWIVGVVADFGARVVTSPSNNAINTDGTRAIFGGINIACNSALTV